MPMAALEGIGMVGDRVATSVRRATELVPADLHTYLFISGTRQQSLHIQGTQVPAGVLAL
jgi:hypothetical protein